MDGFRLYWRWQASPSAVSRLRDEYQVKRIRVSCIGSTIPLTRQVLTAPPADRLVVSRKQGRARPLEDQYKAWSRRRSPPRDPARPANKEASATVGASMSHPLAAAWRDRAGRKAETTAQLPRRGARPHSNHAFNGKEWAGRPRSFGGWPERTFYECAHFRGLASKRAR